MLEASCGPGETWLVKSWSRLNDGMWMACAGHCGVSDTMGGYERWRGMESRKVSSIAQPIAELILSSAFLNAFPLV